MIACKARFVFHGAARHCCVLLLCLWGTELAAQDYLIPPVFEFDREIRDYTQRHLSDNVRFLLFRSEFKVQQTGYSNNSGNLANLQFASDFSILARSDISGLAPGEIDRDLYNAERFTVHLYESIARRWENLNPIPGLLYDVIIRSPAYPFVFLEGIEQYARDFGTYPFTDDLSFRSTDFWLRQFAFGFRLIFG